MCIEAGQLDRAAVLAADVMDLAERQGSDIWRLIGATLQANISALAALGTDDLDPAALAVHIATITTFHDTLRTVELNNYRTFYASILGRVLTAAGQPGAARNHLASALVLAQDTGMCFYDAELLRHAPTLTPTLTPAMSTSAPPSPSLASRVRTARLRPWVGHGGKRVHRFDIPAG